jgi:hypothetical protein
MHKAPPVSKITYTTALVTQTLESLVAKKIMRELETNPTKPPMERTRNRRRGLAVEKRSRLVT